MAFTFISVKGSGSAEEEKKLSKFAMKQTCSIYYKFHFTGGHVHAIIHGSYTMTAWYVQKKATNIRVYMRNHITSLLNNYIS